MIKNFKAISASLFVLVYLNENNSDSDYELLSAELGVKFVDSLRYVLSKLTERFPDIIHLNEDF